MKKITAQIEALSTKQQQLSNRLANLKTRQDRIDRAKETRRLVLAGYWMFKLNGGDRRKVGQRLSEAGLLNQRDRVLFDLDPASPSATQGQQAA